MSNDRWMDEDVAHVHNGIHSALKERIKWCHLQQQRWTQIIMLSEVRMMPYQCITYMWNLKNDTNEFIYVKEKQTHTQKTYGTSLAVQCIRIHRSRQGTRVWSLLREDSTCCGATKPMHHNYWALHCNCWNPCSTRETTTMRRPHKTTKGSPPSLQWKKACTQQWRPTTHKK